MGLRHTLERRRMRREMRREMQQLADQLIDPIRVTLPADPEVLFEALVASVNQWRGREVIVRRLPFPPHTATGVWLERATHDNVIVEERAVDWHQIVILAHEVWHMHQGDAANLHDLAAAARTDFAEAAERDADEFGMLVGRRLRAWLEAADNSALGGTDPSVAGRIAAALNYRGTQPW
ncbi:toxin [Streptomyces sp. NPDC004579]|uniref:toxin n=1 Tax=Streptomyces sp. NPDC004579 TaxID=3154667 RepID=UPI0033A547CB